MSNSELKKQNEELAAKVAELEAQLKQATEQATVVPVTKGRSQALAALELLKKGPVSVADLKALNEKYPSDPIYYVRTILKVEVKTNRAKDGKTTYCLVEATEPAGEQQPEQPAAEEAPAATEPVAEEVAAQ